MCAKFGMDAESLRTLELPETIEDIHDQIIVLFSMGAVRHKNSPYHSCMQIGSREKQSLSSRTLIGCGMVLLK